MPVPSAPTGFAAVATSYGILLTWDTQASIDAFDVYRSAAADHSGEVLLARVDDSILSYVDPSAVANTHYYYRLDASSDADGESTKVAADAVALGGMTLTTARDWVRQFARNAGSTSEYSAADVDRAIIGVCERFLRMTKSVQVAATVSLTADDASFDVSALTLFRPERILRANVLTVECELEMVDWEHLYARQIECTGTGKPRELAFETSLATTGNVWPTPDIAYSLRLRWWQALTSFTPGTASDASTYLNIPSDWLPTILSFGAPSFLQHHEPQHAFAGESWQKYLEFESTMMGAGNRGARVVRRERIR